MTARPSLRHGAASDHAASGKARRLPLAAWDVVILGGGPAGLVCAHEAAMRGLSVALAEKQKKPGRKLSLAGGGMGNVTNRTLGPDYYVGENPAFCRAALRAFGCHEALDLLTELAIPWEERDFGQIFCLKPAAELAEKLTARCRAAGVTLHMGEAPHVHRLFPEPELPTDSHDHVPPERGPAPAEQEKAKARPGELTARAATEEPRFSLVFSDVEWRAAHLVLTTGSPAWPQAGAAGDGGQLAEAWGHRLVPWRAALAPLVMPPDWPLHGLEGISLNARLVVRDPASGKEWHDPCGIRPLLFTHRGLSGPAALAACCHWREGFSLVADFLPELSLMELMHEPRNGKIQARNLVARHLPARLAERLVPEQLAGRRVAELGKKERLRLAGAIHQHSVMPTGTEGLRRAEAATGGIATDELDSRLRSRLVPGLYAGGELVDMTGLLGGYNIHWAMASGTLIGRSLPGRQT